MKQYTAVYYFRDERGRLETTIVDIAANSTAEAKRIAKARVGSKTTTRLVSVTQHPPVNKCFNKCLEE